MLQLHPDKGGTSEKAKAEFEEALSEKGVGLEHARAPKGARQARSIFYPRHRVAGTTGRSVVSEIWALSTGERVTI